MPNIVSVGATVAIPILSRVFEHRPALFQDRRDLSKSPCVLHPYFSKLLDELPVLQQHLQILLPQLQLFWLTEHMNCIDKPGSV